MGHVNEIASYAGQISREFQQEQIRTAEMSSLKGAMEMQSMIAEQLIAMLSEVSPHLGTHLHTVV